MPKGYHHLTHSERSQIVILKDIGKSPTKIAEALKVSQSTVSRELKRNSGKEGYNHEEAQKKATARRNHNPNKKMTPKLALVIEEKLRVQWSPTQVSGWLKKENKEWVSHETIYKIIWTDKQQGGNLYKELRHHGKKYNKRRKGIAGRGCIIGRIDIDERPPIVEEKIRLGDWELDTIIGAMGEDVIVSMVERASKLTRLVKVPRKTAENISSALIASLEPIKAFVHTLTSDNGSEFAYHQKVSRRLDANFYFAHPYHSWERGLNEHTNGLVRQYFPKKTNFAEITIEEVQRVEFLLNTRPRKILNFDTPIERFQKLAKNVVQSTRTRGYLKKSVYSFHALRG
jgi:IS30 family transposase